VGNLAYVSTSKEQMKESTGFWRRNIRKRLIWILLKQDGHAIDLNGSGV
jgi:hypothetical protein